jgi:hypothetical protein
MKKKKNIQNSGDIVVDEMKILQDVSKKHFNAEIEWKLNGLDQSAIFDSATILKNSEIQQVNFDSILSEIS